MKTAIGHTSGLIIPRWSGKIDINLISSHAEAIAEMTKIVVGLYWDMTRAKAVYYDNIDRHAEET